MSGLDYRSGDKIAEAIDRRIVSVAKQVYEKSPNNKTKYGKVLSKKDGLFTIEIEKAVYPNVPALRNVGNINIGEVVVCMVPNNQFSNIMVIGVADGTIETTSSSGSSVNVIDNVNSSSSTDALSANQGRVLNEKISTINNNITKIEDKLVSKTSELTNDGDGTSPFATEEYVSQNGGKIDSISVNGTAQTIDENKNVNIKVPDVSNFITKAVNDLENYYTKSETYTQEEINQRISAIPKFSIKVVTELPTTNISETTVYLVSSGSKEQNLYIEYIYVNNTWEKLGEQTIDLTDYVKTETFNNLVNNTTQIVATDGGFKAGQANIKGIDAVSIGKNTSSLDYAVGIGSNVSANTYSVAIGARSRANSGGGAVGSNAIADDGGGAVGSNARTSSGFAGGKDAKAEADGFSIDAIQLGTGTNSKEKSLQVYDDNIYDAKTHTLTVKNIELNGEDIKDLMGSSGTKIIWREWT